MTGTRSRISRCLALTSQSMRAGGKRAAQRRRHRNGVDDVAERAEADDEERRLPALRYRAAANAREQIARRMILGIADDGGPAAVRLDDGALGHGVDGVVGALAVDVRLESAAAGARRSRRRRSTT